MGIHKPKAFVDEAVVTRSPRRAKKWRVTIPSRGVTIDFGQRGASDFTRHKDAARMLRYLLRHAAEEGMSDQLRAQRGATHLDPRRPRDFDADAYAKAVEEASHVRTSRREKWSDVTTPGFWSRWLLWSKPSLEDAAGLIEDRFR